MHVRTQIEAFDAALHAKSETRRPKSESRVRVLETDLAKFDRRGPRTAEPQPKSKTLLTAEYAENRLCTRKSSERNQSATAYHTTFYAFYAFFAVRSQKP